MAERLDRLYADPAGDLFETFSFHERFHRRIAECTGCPALSEAIERNHILIFQLALQQRFAIQQAAFTLAPESDRSSREGRSRQSRPEDARACDLWHGRKCCAA